MNKYGLINEKKYLVYVAPNEAIRAFDSKKLIGKIVNFKFEKFDDKKTYQYVYGKCKDLGVSIDGWIKPLIEKKIFKRKIIDCGLIMHKNGGRSDHHIYKSYWDFFNEERKQEIFKRRNGGLLAVMLSGSGEPDQADLWLKFNDFEIDTFWFDCIAPEEWESERLKDKIDFDFKHGFYKNAIEAIECFSSQSHEDIFGTRFFPVVVFNNTTEEEVINHVRCMPKSSTVPIFGKEKIVIGTRCKSYRRVSSSWIFRLKEVDMAKDNLQPWLEIWIIEYANKEGISVDSQVFKEGLAVIEAESDFDYRAIRVNENGTVDTGIAQFNSLWYWIKEKIIHPKDALNPEIAIPVFWKYFPKRKNDWNTFKSGKYKEFL